MLSPHHCLMLQLFARFLPQRKQARFLAIWFLFEYQSVKIEFEDIHHNIQARLRSKRINAKQIHDGSS